MKTAVPQMDLDMSSWRFWANLSGTESGSLLDVGTVESFMMPLGSQPVDRTNLAENHQKGK